MRRVPCPRPGRPLALRRVDGGSFHVGASGWEGPGEPAGGGSGVDFPVGLLFVEVVAAADGSAGAQAGDAAFVVGGGVLVVTGPVGGAAGGEGAFLVQDRGQVL